MLKKNDLVKQFELVVKQEIINHNAQIQQSNSSMNALQTEVASLKKDVKTLLEERGQDKKKIEIFEKQLKKSECAQQEFESKIKAAFERLQTKIAAELEIAVLNSVQANHNSETNKAFIENSSHQIDVFRDEILGFHEIFRNELKHMEIRALAEIKKAKKEILEMPSEATKFKEALEQKIQEKAIDAEGYLKELAILKKELFIHEKKLENLYTLMERTKKGGRYL